MRSAFIILLTLLISQSLYAESKLEAIYGQGEQGFQKCLEANYQELGEEGAINYCVQLESDEVEIERSKEALGGRYFERKAENLNLATQVVENLKVFESHHLDPKDLMDFYTNPNNQFAIAGLGTLLTYGIVNGALVLLSRGKVKVPLNQFRVAVPASALVRNGGAFTLRTPGNSYNHFDLEKTLKKLNSLNSENLSSQDLVTLLSKELSRDELRYLVRALSEIREQQRQEFLDLCGDSFHCSST